MLELKDFDCQRTYEQYWTIYKDKEEKKKDLDMPGRWRDSIGDRFFVKHEGIYYPYLTTEKRLLSIEILLKRLIEEK